MALPWEIDPDELIEALLSEPRVLSIASIANNYGITVDRAIQEQWKAAEIRSFNCWGERCYLQREVEAWLDSAAPQDEDSVVAVYHEPPLPRTPTAAAVASEEVRQSGRYWEPVTSLHPCSCCKRTSQCSISRDDKWAHCAYARSSLPSAAGGWLHKLDSDLTDPPQPFEAYDLRVLFEGSFVEVPAPKYVEFCGKSGPVIGDRRTGKIHFLPKPCGSTLCHRCGKEWCEALLNYYWGLWSRRRSVWCAKKFETLDFGKVRDRIQGQAERSGSQYLLVRRRADNSYGLLPLIPDVGYVFSTRKLQGKSEPSDWEEVEPNDALLRLQDALRLPGALTVSTSNWGSWALPTIPRKPKGEDGGLDPRVHLGFRTLGNVSRATRQVWRTLSAIGPSEEYDLTLPPPDVEPIRFVNEVWEELRKKPSLAPPSDELGEET